ncbi:MAG: hypothetical protein SVM80_12325 [Halobacteriota archaeon]|nr:hypothetical protein [Halobacteriota archaeon]
MKRPGWEVTLGIFLVVLSAILYTFHFAVFRDSHHIFIYLVGDIAFVPIEVLIVTLIIHRLLEVREKQSRMEKLNMVIGAFFSEVGTRLLTYISDFDPKLEDIKKDLLIESDWTEEEFSRVSELLKNYDYSVDIKKIDLEGLGNFLLQKRNFLTRLLENQNLLEHESFTDLLWAVFHLTEELASRKDIMDLPETDYEHLAGDIKRSYTILVGQWLDYMEHLKNNYPYLFSLAMRTNPFDEEASPIVK